MKFKFLLILFLCFGFLQSVESKACNSTNEIPYWEIKPNDFFDLPEVKQAIDINNPNEYLLSVSIFHASNLVRITNNLPTFIPNKALSDASKTHIKDMIAYNFWGHVNPVLTTNQTPIQRVQNHDGRFKIVGENLAKFTPFYLDNNGNYKYRKRGNHFTYFDLKGNSLRTQTYEDAAKSLVRNWYLSPGHRKNLLHPQLTHIGVAAKLVGNYGTSNELPFFYAVQEFGSYCT